jgi:Mrp family chromosome partitioning ATPase
VGGVVVVVGTQTIKQQDLEKSLGSLEMVDANILGVVLNRLPVKGPDAYSYTYYSHDPTLGSRKNPARSSTKRNRVGSLAKSQ